MSVRQFTVLLEWDAETDAWVTYVPALDHLSTFGTTLEESLANTQDAILCWIEAAQKEGLPVPPGSLKLELVELEVATA